jgi:hypothetical protein
MLRGKEDPMRSLFAAALLAAVSLPVLAAPGAYARFKADVESFKGRTVQEYMDAHPNIQPMLVHAAKFDYYAFGSNSSYADVQPRGTPSAPSARVQQVNTSCTWGLVTDPGDSTIKDVVIGKSCEAMFELD